MLETSFFDIQWYIVFMAFVFDFIFVDPKNLFHPIYYMGKAIIFFESIFQKYFKNGFLAGLFLATFLILLVFLSSLSLLKLSIYISPFTYNIVQIILLFFCFSSSGLQKASLKVFDALKNKNIKDARTKLSMIVSRQTDNLDKDAIRVATIETIAENFVDGFLSPLFFAIVGGVPCALAYKMINTLDSMIGYKNEKYLLFGKASARIDDVANFIPARLSVFIISFCSCFFSLQRGFLSLKIGLTQGSFAKSPNAGYPMAVFCGALKMKLGQDAFYDGVLIKKSFIGKEFEIPTTTKIAKACDLMMLSSFIATFLTSLFLFLF